MRFRKTKEHDIRLGIAPLIDIVFLLLIFFMVTSHFDMASGVRIQLPKVTKKFFNEQEDKTVLVVDKSGKVYLKGETVDPERLGDRLRQLVEKENLSRLILQADKDVRHGKVVEIIDTAKASGIQAVIIAAQWKSGKI